MLALGGAACLYLLRMLRMLRMLRVMRLLELAERACAVVVAHAGGSAHARV